MDLKLESPIFDDMRKEFNELLFTMLTKMVATSNDESKINLTLTLGTQQQIGPDGEEYIEPKFKYEIKTEIKESIKYGSGIVGQYELAFVGGEWILREPPSNQTKFF